MGSPQVSVVLPCFNEEESVGLCVEQAARALEGARMPGEVLVVDNGSTDRSADVARMKGARVVTESRQGYGRAIRAGIAAASGGVVVMADADCSYDLDRVPDLARPVQSGDADLVMGVRRVAGRRDMPLLHRFLGTPLLTFLIGRATGGRSVRDTQSGFRAFSRSAALRLGLRATGMELTSEMVIVAIRHGWRIREVPTEYRARVGKSKLKTVADGWRNLRLIALLAPDLLLVWPGTVALLAGLVLAVWSLIDPAGIQVGSIRWQPVFFSTIAMVFGVQALLAGSVVAYVSSVSPGSTRRKFSFVGDPGFLSWCARGGLAAGAVGLLIDLVLLVLWASGHPPWNRALPLAGLAQGFVITGITVASFSLVTRLMLTRGERADVAPRGLAALLASPHRARIARPESEVHERMARSHGSP